MLAIDHGYFQGPTTGLERVDLSIVPLLGYADALMATRGIVRAVIPPASGTPIVLRASGGPSILKELSDERVAVSMEDAARINAAAVAVQVFVGGEFETQSVHNMTRLVDESQRYGIPVLAVTAVGKELTRDARYLRLATRICAELGAHVVDVLLRRGLRHGNGRLPGAGRHGWREKAARTRGPHDGLPRHGGRSGRSRHGPEHIPEPRPGRDDPRGQRDCARVGQAASGIRPVFNGNAWPQPAGG
jgi:DeoC/LacD family aldolase